MKRFAYFKIDENMTPVDASKALETANKSGYDSVIVFHGESADLKKAKYKEKILAVLRAAYRHKTDIYLSDDVFFSGTGFGQLSSVRSLWQKRLVKKLKTEAIEEEIISEKDEVCIVSEPFDEVESFPFGHYVDLTNPDCAFFAIEAVYAPLIKEYEKFVGYELKGFCAYNPLYDLPECDCVPYSLRATEKYKEKYNKEVDFFTLAENGKKDAQWEKYALCIRECIEEGYIMPLKKYCEEKGLELISGGGEKSVSIEFCEKEKIMYLTEDTGKKGGSLLCKDDTRRATEAFLKKMCAVVPIGVGMDKVAKCEEFLKKHNDVPVFDVKDIQNIENGAIITNMSDETVSVGLLFEGDWCVCDGEKEELYDFEKRTTYTFYPYSFLCVRKKAEGMYTDALPVRVGGVVTCLLEDKTKVEFARRENRYAFYLPDEPIFGKCVEFLGNCDKLKVKMGSMEHVFIARPHILPLYDFLRDAGCVVDVYDGDIEEIVIREKAEMD